jgi:hypothetical protein
MTRNSRGTVVVEVVVVLALIFLVAKPAFLDGDSRRAKKSEEATAAVVATVDKVDEAEKKRSAVAAASVVKIGEANATAPASPEKEFIAREVPVALANMEAPDPHALLEAERRKVAVLEGQIALADRLYGDAMSKAEKLSEAKAKAERERDLALAARDRIDRDLSEAAAAKLAMERQRNIFILVGALAVGLWIWAKITHFSPGQVASAVKDLNAKTYPDPVTALDTAATPLQQKLVRFIRGS